MNAWITPDIARQIAKICNVIAYNDFETLNREDRFEFGTAG